MTVLAACHVHSDWSYDGKKPLEVLAAEFCRWGRRVLMMTEHDLGFTEARRIEHREACARASTEKILVMPGIEYSDGNNLVHLLVWGDVPFCGEGVSTGAVLESVSVWNGVAVLAHPARRDAWKFIDPAWAGSLTGVEFWNRKCDGWAPGKKAPFLLGEHGLIPFAGLDFHDNRQRFPLAMALETGTDVNEDTVLEALRSRRCGARVFGLAVNSPSFKRTLPVLRLAESFRRSAARIYKPARAGNGVHRS